MDIFILAGTPGADPTDPRVVEWTAICHRKADLICISHRPHVDTSRWTHKPRKRAFIVELRAYSRMHYMAPLGASATLAGALKIAAAHKPI